MKLLSTLAGLAMLGGVALSSGTASAMPVMNTHPGRIRPPYADRNGLLLLLPEREQPLRRRAADHTGNADLDLAQRRRGNAAQRERADTDLAPEIEVAPRV